MSKNINLQRPFYDIAQYDFDVMHPRLRCDDSHCNSTSKNRTKIDIMNLENKSITYRCK